jgi:integrase
VKRQGRRWRPSRWGATPGAARRRGTAADGSLEAASTLYFERHVAGLRKGTRLYVRRELDRMNAAWPGRPAVSISKRDVIAHIDTAVERKWNANTTWKVAKALFGWLADRDDIENSPAASIRRPTKEVARDRVLDDAELRLIWHKANEVGGPSGALIKLLILTGCRKTEIAALERSELTADAIVLPRERTKSNVAHQVFLTPLMRIVLDGCPTTGRFVLNGADRPLSANGREKDRIKVAIPPWTVHDIRRSFASGCARIGIAPHVIEQMLNHAMPGVAGRYNKHQYGPETRDGWEKWSAHVEAITGYGTS